MGRVDVARARLQGLHRAGAGGREEAPPADAPGPSCPVKRWKEGLLVLARALKVVGALS